MLSVLKSAALKIHDFLFSSGGGGGDGGEGRRASRNLRHMMSVRDTRAETQRAKEGGES